MADSVGPGEVAIGRDGGGEPELARRLGLFDATMIVMGGIIGSGIFLNPAVVARRVSSPALILGAWAAGGAIALVGAFLYAELAARRPKVGGQYAYLREAYHPSLAFLYGWGLLLVTQTGGMAAVAVTFARYFRELTGLPLADGAGAALALALLSLVNCLGVRAGAGVQSALMVAKLAAIGALVVCGLALAPAAPPSAAPAPVPSGSGWDLLTAFGSAMVPVLFAYGGWQTAAFVSTEIREPRKNLPRGLILGVFGVVALYLLVSEACLAVLGPAGLAATEAPASEVMKATLGPLGGRLIAAGIAISTLGFLSQSMLTAPRVYFAMARDGLFPRLLAGVHPRTRVPVAAIALQGLCAAGIAVSGRYEQILSYVVSVDWVFFALAAGSLFALRRRDREAGTAEAPFVRSGHPLTTWLFLLVCVAVVANTVYKAPRESAVGLGILLAGVPVYLAWSSRRAASPPPSP